MRAGRAPRGPRAPTPPAAARPSMEGTPPEEGRKELAGGGQGVDRAPFAAVALRVEGGGAPPARLDVRAPAGGRPGVTDHAAGAGDLHRFAGRIGSGTHAHRGVLRPA